MRRSAAKIGDVLEILTSRGLAYAQYTNQIPKRGGLLRVIEGCYENRPSDLAALVKGDLQFETLFPVTAAVSRGIFAVVGNVQIPHDRQALPVFRSGMPPPGGGPIRNWWLWDGEREWQVGVLDPEQWKLPRSSIINDTLLVERIESGWRQEGAEY